MKASASWAHKIPTRQEQFGPTLTARLLEECVSRVRLTALESAAEPRKCGVVAGSHPRFRSPLSSVELRAQEPAGRTPRGRACRQEPVGPIPSPAAFRDKEATVKFVAEAAVLGLWP